MSYNCREDLFGAIESVNANVSGNCEVIVVDNGSTDNTAQEIGSRFPKVNFIFNQVNIGFSAACNQGVKISNGEVLLFLNPDAKLLDKNIRKAVEKLSENYPAILGPEILNPDGTLQDSVIKIPGASSVLAEAFFLSYGKKQVLETTISENEFALSGAALLMFRSVFDKLDGFDEDLFWMDDVDLCFRARQKGFRLMYFREWKIQHKIGVSSKKNYPKVISNQLVSKLKFFRKNNLWGAWTVSIFATELHVLFRIILFLLLCPFKREFRQKFVAYLYAQAVLPHYVVTGGKKIY